MPVVFYKDPMAAMDWLKRAFGLEMGLIVTDQEGGLAHAEMSWRGLAIGVGGEWAAEDLLGSARLTSPAGLDGAGTQFLRLFLEDGIDAHCEQARAAGARITQEPTTQFYGDRTYRALDLEGHVWNFAQRITEMTVDEMQEASGLSFRARGDA